MRAERDTCLPSRTRKSGIPYATGIPGSGPGWCVGRIDGLPVGTRSSVASRRWCTKALIRRLDSTQIDASAALGSSVSIAVRDRLWATPEAEQASAPAVAEAHLATARVIREQRGHEMSGEQQRRMMDEADELPTLVGEEAHVCGNLEGRGRLVVYGVVEGDSDFNGGVVVADRGRWIGTLIAVDVVISGTVEGDVIARARLELGPTARVTGSLTAGKIAIAEGAQVEGNLNITGVGEAHHFRERRSKWSRLVRRVGLA